MSYITGLDWLVGWLVGWLGHSLCSFEYDDGILISTKLFITFTEVVLYIIR